MIASKRTLRGLSAILLCGIFTAAPAAAQRPDVRNSTSADTGTVSFGASFSASNRVHRSGTDFGDVAVTALQAGFGSSARMGDDGARVTYGIDYVRFGLDRDASVPLPESLTEVVLPIGVAGTFALDWTGRVVVRPGLYGNSLGFVSSEINAPVMALAAWRQSAELSLSFGLRYDAWARHALLPLAGVNWKFAPDWELAVGLPRTGVSWQFNPNTALRLGATMQGGSFHVTDHPRPRGSTVPWLGATKLDYREIRVGAAIDVMAHAKWSVLADVGVIVNQRFDYHRQHYRLAGDNAPYASLAVRGRF
jgi:hypothetical protein